MTVAFYNTQKKRKAERTSHKQRSTEEKMKTHTHTSALKPLQCFPVQKEITDAVGLVPSYGPGVAVCVCVSSHRCPFCSLAWQGPSGRAPNKRLVWRLCWSPVQNAAVKERPMERRDRSMGFEGRRNSEWHFLGATGWADSSKYLIHSVQRVHHAAESKTTAHVHLLSDCSPCVPNSANGQQT